jgi:hypothetical protein
MASKEYKCSVKIPVTFISKKDELWVKHTDAGKYLKDVLDRIAGAENAGYAFEELIDNNILTVEN